MSCVFSRHFSHGPISSPPPPTPWYCIAFFSALFFTGQVNQCQMHITKSLNRHFPITPWISSPEGDFFFYNPVVSQHIQRWLKSRLGYLVQSIDLYSIWVVHISGRLSYFHLMTSLNTVIPLLLMSIPERDHDHSFSELVYTYLDIFICFFF